MHLADPVMCACGARASPRMNTACLLLDCKWMLVIMKTKKNNKIWIPRVCA